METLIIKGYKYRIYPTEEQKLQLSKTFGCCRFVYNKLLALKNVEIKDLTIRKWRCPNFGIGHDRDKNAEINILREGLRILEIK